MGENKRLTFKNKSACRRYAAMYRKQLDLGLDGKPRKRGKYHKEKGSSGGAKHVGS